MNSAVTTALRSRRFRVWPLSLLLLGFVGGTTAAMAGSCDCKLASLPVCAQGTAKKPFDLQLLSGDGQLGVLQGYLQLRRSLIETAPARRLEVDGLDRDAPAAFAHDLFHVVGFGEADDRAAQRRGGAGRAVAVQTAQPRRRH